MISFISKKSILFLTFICATSMCLPVQWDAKALMLSYRKKFEDLNAEQKEKIKIYAIAGGVSIMTIVALLIGYKIQKRGSSGSSQPLGSNESNNIMPPPPPPPPATNTSKPGNKKNNNVVLPPATTSPTNGPKNTRASLIPGKNDVRLSMIAPSAHEIKNMRKSLRKMTVKPGQLSAVNPSIKPHDVAKEILSADAIELQEVIEEFLIPKLTSHKIPVDAIWNVAKGLKSRLLDGVPQAEILKIDLNWLKLQRIVFTYQFNVNAAEDTEEELNLRSKKLSAEQQEYLYYAVGISLYLTYWFKYQEYLEKTNNVLITPKDCHPFDVLNHLLSLYMGHKIDLSEEIAQVPKKNDAFNSAPLSVKERIAELNKANINPQLRALFENIKTTQHVGAEK